MPFIPLQSEEPDYGSGDTLGPCNWPTPLCPAPTGDDQYAEFVAEAQFILWSMTGQKFGICDVVVQPVPACCGEFDCMCGDCKLALPGPVFEVLEVQVCGEVYENWVLAGDYLYSSARWPRNVTVRYLRGRQVPAGGARVVGELAKQLSLAACGDKRCALPPNVTSRTRQGDTVTMSAPVPGKIGIPLIDMWVTAANGVNAPAGVWSPDVPPLTMAPYVTGS